MPLRQGFGVSRFQPLLAARADQLAQESLARPGAPAALPERLLVVDSERSHATWFEEGKPKASWRISTARAGIGGAEGSYRTPPGWHRIARRIGEGAELGTVFISREPTGEIWHGEARPEDLILTRILTLEGLEPGVNSGPGCDSLARYIYIHGTNHEALLGRPVSHGCVRMSNDDIRDLFAQMAEGDHVLITEPASRTIPDPFGPGRFHYAGLAGSGMSALAQFQAMNGGRASGSDRAFDRGERAEFRSQLEVLGIEVLPQDGTGLEGDCSALVVSTAVEEKVPDFAAAKQKAIPILHRSELLAHFVSARRTIAVSGTSGKSTTTAMIFELLLGTGRDPSVITGGDIRLLQERRLPGNAWAGGSDLLVVEADESDGSLVRYAPAIGVILNLHRDHREMDEVAGMFEVLRARASEALIVGEGDNLNALAGGTLRFGFGPKANVRAENLVLGADGSTFQVGSVSFALGIPGRHNVENALAAIAVGGVLGIPLSEMAGALAGYRGIGRRFELIGHAGGIEVVDDFAHNAEKIAASLATAQRRAARVLAIYQPHGYGPTRFLRHDFVETFSRSLRPQDRLWMLEVFYAGGTAIRDFSSADIVEEIASRGVSAEFAGSREWLSATIAEEARPGDLILVMGARDPSLSDFARDILAEIGCATGDKSGCQDG
jgi:UDP-N-acetylmuramate--alanine ligase